jgi:hypothetical protein
VEYVALTKSLMRGQPAAGGQPAGGDLNRDGKISDDEKAFNQVSLALKRPTLYTPAELARLQLKQKELKQSLGLV